MLTAMSAMNQLDRQILSIVLEPIRREFALSDVQLGLLSGLAFASLYTTLSIPAAAWSARHSKRNLIATAAAVWGSMTILCGIAQSFAHLFVARVGVGVGEAGGMPPSHAVISADYPPGERATAMAIWASGANIGVLFAFAFGGLMAQQFGWRSVFFAAGATTILFSVVFRLTVTEAPQAAKASPPKTIRSIAEVRGACRLLWRDPVLRHVCCGATIMATVSYGALAWIPSYLVRSHHLGTATIGVYLATTIGVGGALGTWLGGRWSDTLRRRDMRWSLWLIALLLIVSKPFSFAFYLSDSSSVALALFVVPAALGATFMGPSIAILHDRVPPDRRPMISAIYLLLVNFIGLGLGPLVTGALSEFLFASSGADSLRYALLVMQIVGVWGSQQYWQAGRRLLSQTP